MGYNYSAKKGRSNRRRAGRKFKGVSKKLLSVIRKVDQIQEFKRQPLRHIIKSRIGNVGLGITPPAALFQCPYQDIPLALSAVKPNELGRNSATIYPQWMEFDGYMLSMVGTSRTKPQRFRVVVVRYKGEMDFDVNNGNNNGFDQETQTTHMPRVGASWESLPYVRNQIQVLYDKTFTINLAATFQLGLRVHFKVNIQKKLTFEEIGSGPSAVGAGNVYIGICSDDLFTVADYVTTATYKEM